MNKRKRKRNAFLSIVLAFVFVFTSLPSFSLLTVKASQNNLRNVMYYGDWSIWGGEGNFYPKDIPAENITHLNFAFLAFDGNGNLKFTDKDAAIGAPVGQVGAQWGGANAGILNALQDLRAKNPNMRVGVSIGGWSKSAEFSNVAKSPEATENFVNNILKFIKYMNLDFVDLDWEYPNAYRLPDLVDNKNDEGTPFSSPADKQNYINLLSAIREGLDKQGSELGKYYELTVALPAPQRNLSDGIDVAALFSVVDFANIMTYDMRGAWSDTTGHHTALYGNPNDPTYDTGLSVDQTVDYLIANGAPSNKIVVGVALYTRGWDTVEAGNNPAAPGLFQPAATTNKDADQSPTRGANNEKSLSLGDGGRAGGVWSYGKISQLKAKDSGLVEYWDDIAKAPYMYSPVTKDFYTFENLRSVTEKANYVKNRNLGGLIGWMSSQDAPTSSSTVRDELTKSMKEGLFGKAPLAQNNIVYSDLNVTVEISTYTENGSGYEFKIKNNEVSNESNEVLNLTELSAETIKLPKLYINLSSDEVLSSGDHLAGTVTSGNGYAVVDLSSVYDGKEIKQNTEYKFRLKSNIVPEAISAITSVELSQRMTISSLEFGRQYIYDVGSQPINYGPVLKGIENISIPFNGEFDPLNGVTASDKEDGDLTGNIIVTGSVNVSISGDYTLKYEVTDSAGKVASATRVVTVKNEETTPVDPIDPPVDPVDPVDPIDPPTDPVDPIDPPVDPIDPPVDPVEPSITVWSYDLQSKGYLPGAKVTHNGKVWLQTSTATLWWGEPGIAPEWQYVEEDATYDPDANIKPWDAAHHASFGYKSGEKVIHNDKVWIQSNSSTTWWGEPGVSADWVEVR